MALALAIQKNEPVARALLERLVEAGLVEPHGVKKGRTYTLSAKIYRKLGGRSDYIRQAGFEPIQQEQMVLQYVRKHGRITRGEAAELCRLGSHQAKRLMARLVRDGRIKMQGKKKGAFYERGPNI
mgnify:CR=1 FL=1